MFNLNEEVNRLQQLQHNRIYGLPYKRKLQSPAVEHIDGGVLEEKAEQEGQYISRSFHNRSIGFGKRLRKVKGQKHYPGGGYAGHTIRILEKQICLQKNIMKK